MRGGLRVIRTDRGSSPLQLVAEKVETQEQSAGEKTFCSLNFLLILFLTGFSFAIPYEQCFISASQHYGVPYELLIAIAQVESGLNPRAINRNKNGTVDRGIMQINTSWDSYLRRYGIDPRWVWEPCYNIHLGAMVLRRCIDTYGNSWRAVDCYNKGSRARENSRYVWNVYRAMQKFYAVR